MTIAGRLAPPVVVRGSRLPAVTAAIVGALGLGMMALLGTPWGAGVRPLSLTTSVLGASVFGALEILSLIAVLIPDRLEISPTGVSVRHLWFAHRFGWDQLNSFRLVQVRGLDGLERTIAIAADGARVGRRSPRLTYPKWELPTAEVLALLQDGRARWAGSALVPDKATRPSAPLVLGDRMGRASYWTLVAAITACGAGLSLLPQSDRLHGGLVAVLIFLSRRRLHDIGLSGWWSIVALPAGLVVLLAADNLAYLQYSLRHGLSPAAAALWSGLALASGLLIWLGIKSGDPADNRYGVAPAARPRLIF